MRNFRITLQYEGTRYQGWQRQESTDNTIQGKLETLLTKMAQSPNGIPSGSVPDVGACRSSAGIEVQGSGRTDAGVHAMGQVANFHMNTDMREEEIMEYMNFYLPEDIGVIALEEVPERFHSRLNAKGKTYCYRVVNSGQPHVFDRKYVHVLQEPLDMEAMERAAQYLIGTHDFKAFTSSKKGKKSTVRTIDSIRIEKTASLSMSGRGVQDEIRMWYSGNGFLYHMVRIMTGTLLEVGTHKRKPEEVGEILAQGCREAAGELVPAKGLTLMEVRYQ